MTAGPKLKLDWCSHEAAKHAVEHWHYSGSLPAGKSVKIGVWENGRFVGAVIFSLGANNNLSRPYGLTMQQCCELVRVALTRHETPVSRILTIALKLLKRQSPGVRLVVSFADTRQGHHGGIYQGSNWIYTGLVETSPDYFCRGRWMHQRNMNALFGTIKGFRGKKRPGAPKHKYLYPLDNETRQQVMPLSKPYPKRAGSIGADAAMLHMAEGGSTPTPALHSSQ